MSDYGELETFGGFEVKQWQIGDPLGDPATTIHRLSAKYDGDHNWAELLAAYLAQNGVEQVQGLVVGYWSTDILMETDPVAEMLEPLVAAAAQLPKLRVLYVGDIAQHESEISWIENTEMAPILKVFPNLTHFGVSGGNNLRLSDLNQPQLKHLIVQAGGVSAELVRDVMTAKLPSLEHLELYLGTEEYGATSSADDLAPILDGKLFPKLTYLGLKNSDYEDQIAQMVANAPVLDGLDTLDLSMGVLTDEGAKPLLASEKVKALKKLDVSHNYFSEEVIAQLEALPIEVDASDNEEPDDDWMFVALGE